MSGPLATLNGVAVTSARVQIPAWGLWFAEVECASTDVLKGAVTLVIDDLTLKGTVLTGGAYQSRTRYRVVGGAGGWGKVLAAKAYANDLGVKFSTVLGDAARECGEQLGAVPSGTSGPSFVRANEPAARVLDELFARGWYVDEAGVTQIGRRLTSQYAGALTIQTKDTAQGRVDIAPSSGIAKLLPGVVIAGVEAVDVELVVDDKVRASIWGRGIADTSRLPSALARIVETFTAGHRFFAPWEYRVVQRNGERHDLQIARVSSGMPDLRNVRVRPGVAGLKAHAKLGSLVHVAFTNGDPSRPAIVAFDDPESPGFIPDDIALQAGTTGAQPTEHATSAEALVLFTYEFLVAFGGTIAPTPVTPAQVKTALTTALGLMSSKTLDDCDAVPGTTASTIASLLSGKSVDTNGKSPGLGWPSVRGA